MKLLTLARYDEQMAYAKGSILLEGVNLCDCLEPAIGLRLPKGVYALICCMSPNLKYEVLYIQTHIPRSGYELHRGNTIADSRGCPLPGFFPSKSATNLIYSTEALNLIISLYKRDAFNTLSIL